MPWQTDPDFAAVSARGPALARRFASVRAHVGCARCGVGLLLDSVAPKELRRHYSYRVDGCLVAILQDFRDNDSEQLHASGEKLLACRELCAEIIVWFRARSASATGF